MKKFKFFSVSVALVMALFVSVWAGSQTVTSSDTMGVYNVPVGAFACSMKYHSTTYVPMCSKSYGGISFTINYQY
jgi:hypothetical protein